MLAMASTAFHLRAVEVQLAAQHTPRIWMQGADFTHFSNKHDVLEMWVLQHVAWPWSSNANPSLWQGVSLLNMLNLKSQGSKSCNWTVHTVSIMRGLPAMQWGHNQLLSLYCLSILVSLHSPVSLAQSSVGSCDKVIQHTYISVGASSCAQPSRGAVVTALCILNCRVQKKIHDSAPFCRACWDVWH